MEKKLLKFTLTFLVLVQLNTFVHAEENIIFPKKKPVLQEIKTSEKVGNYLIPIKKPAEKKNK